MLKPQLSLKGRALRYLSMREYSRVELARKLAPFAQENDDVEAVLQFLEANNFLSDQRFSASLVNRRQSRYGNQKIFAELQSHQLSKEDIEKLKTELVNSEGERATQVLHKKFSDPPNDHAEKAKQMTFLAQRGFSTRAINEALRATRESSFSEEL